MGWETGKALSQIQIKIKSSSGIKIFLQNIFILGLFCEFCVYK